MNDSQKRNVDRNHNDGAGKNVADRKKETQRLQVGAVSVDVLPIEITKRVREEPNEYELEDGSVIRVTNPTVVVYRVEGFKDWKQNPGYYVENGTSVIVVRGPRQDEEPTQ
jgi:hypothetical protein